MADYTDSKSTQANWKLSQIEPTGSRLDTEPVITPELVRTRFLFGIPLYSAMKDPVTRLRAAYTDAMIKDEIDGAISEAEIELHIDIFPHKYHERHAFDRLHYNSFGYFRVEHRPAYSLDKLTVTTSNEVDVFTVPLQWAETGNLAKGQINLIPMGIALNGSDANGVVTGQSAGGAAFLAILGHAAWIAAFWNIDYTTGFPDGMLPRPVNDYIGCIVAMRVLSKLAATYATSNSASLGIDGLSQSVSTGGPQIFVQRLQEIAEQRKLFRKKLRSMYATNIFTGEV